MGSYFGDSPAFLIPICFICCSCFISSPETESRHSAACRLFSNKCKHQGMLSGLNECKRCWKYYTWFVFSAQWYPMMSTCMAFLGEWSSQVVLPGNPPAKADLIPGSGRFPGGGNGNPLQYSCLENSMNRGAWQATVHVITELDMTEHARTLTPVRIFCFFFKNQLLTCSLAK